jgi:TolB-like protein
MTLLLPALMTTAAPAATVAVLPLAPADDAQGHAGLGPALSGMITADLSTVPGLQLVERERLDAIRAELDLAKSDYIDPKAAVTLGHGLSAQAVVSGHFAVVDKQLALDAQLVDVETGAVLKAATSHGDVKDFVAVEKELVEAFVAGLGLTLDAAAHRRLLMQTPTESFDAFSKYGEGLQATANGDEAAAKAAYEAALQADPQFELARDALVGLQALIQSEQARAAAAAGDAHATAMAAVLARYPADVAGTKATQTTPESTMDTMVGFALRLSVLEDQGRDCERVQEMERYLDRVDWDVHEPAAAGPQGGVFSWQAQRVAKELGYSRLPYNVPGPERAHDDPSSRGSKLFRSTADFILDEDARNVREVSGGLVGSIRRCLPASDAAEAIDKVRKKVLAHGQGAAVTKSGPPSQFSLDESLSLLWAWLHAGSMGADAALTERTAALLAAHPDTDPLASTMRTRLDETARRAADWQLALWRRHGQTEDQLRALLKAIDASDPAVIRTETPICTSLHAIERPRAHDWLMGDADRAKDSEGYHLMDVAGLGRFYAEYHDAGCLVGVKARFADLPALMAFLAEARKSPRPADADARQCDQGWSNTDLFQTRQNLDNIARYPPAADSTYIGLLMTYESTLVFYRCVEVP